MKKIQFYFLVFLSSFFFSYSINSAEIDIYKKIDLFGEVLEKINKQYVDEIDQSEGMDSAINGLLQSLDPYSSYMSPEIFQEMQTETSGEFGCLGIEVSMEAGVVKVITPIDDTPASKAGIKAGDYIVKIDNVQVQGKSLSEAVDLMRGLVGTEIELTVRRRGEKKALTFKITREIIEIQSVKSDLLENNIGYIRLTSFNDNSSDQIKEKIKKLKENENLKAFILDLRNNPGGLLTQAIKISDFFLDNGEIVSTKSRKKSENRKWFARKGDITDGKTLVVLINYGSASASEIVAGALKDHKRAILIGENGAGQNRTGKGGDDLFLKVPLGTQVFEEDNKTLLFDFNKRGEEFVVAIGGKGGLGNTRFKSSTNRAPRKFTKGGTGEEFTIWLQLKTIADIGIIGLPNAGKSSLLAAITNANPKIANYRFTTLNPNLGVASYDDKEITIADIPGLVEGAHEGVGLGIQFLKHIERCKSLLHLIDITNLDLNESYEQVKSELRNYSAKLIEKKELVVLNKVDLVDEGTVKDVIDHFSKGKDCEIMTMTTLEKDSISKIKAKLLSYVS